MSIKGIITATSKYQNKLEKSEVQSNFSMTPIRIIKNTDMLMQINLACVSPKTMGKV
jgi:hypothetical protein